MKMIQGIGIGVLLMGASVAVAAPIIFKGLKEDFGAGLQVGKTLVTRVQDQDSGVHCYVVQGLSQNPDVAISCIK